MPSGIWPPLNASLEAARGHDRPRVKQIGLSPDVHLATRMSGFQAAIRINRSFCGRRFSNRASWFPTSGIDSHASRP
jgi:hypothetical protein